MAASTPRKKKSVKDLIRSAQLPLEKAKICTRPDLVDEYEALAADLAAAKTDRDSLAGNPQIPRLEERLAELKEQIEEATIEFKIRGLPAEQYTKLAAKYPAREGDRMDIAAGGVNRDEIAEQLIRLGTVDPILDEDDWQYLLGTALNNVGYQQLTLTAWAANNIPVSAPF